MANKKGLIIAVLLCTIFAAGLATFFIVRGPARRNGDSEDSPSSDSFSASSNGVGSCCAAFENIPWLEFEDADVPVDELLGDCDRSEEVTAECFHRNCNNAKTHKSCLKCCEMRDELGIQSFDCEDKCADEYTCTWPTASTTSSYGNPVCTGGDCGAGKTCTLSPNSDYCRCVMME